MGSSASAVALSTRPSLPYEVQGHILRYCDAPTLAVSSRVSLAFLELAGPLLYRDMTITGKKQLDKLAKAKSGPPHRLGRIAFHVSLVHTRDLTYNPVTNRRLHGSDASVPLASFPIPIDKLVIDLRSVPMIPETSDLDGHPVCLPKLLSSFAPTHLHVLGSPNPYSRIAHHLALPPMLNWPNIRRATFTASFLAFYPPGANSLAYRNPLVDLEVELPRYRGPEADMWDSMAEMPSLCYRLNWAGWSEEEQRETGRPAFGLVRVLMEEEGERGMVRLTKGWNAREVEVGVIGGER